MSDENQYLKNLFQHEFTKMIAVISKFYGLEHIEIAEDIVSDTFLSATETWREKGVPANPAAWLYMVAEQKTLYHFRRNKIFDEKVVHEIKHSQEKQTEINEPDFSDKNIKDSQLRMLFAICNPAIASESQIGLALRILCGFGIDEIAEALLSNKETINKRLFRAKEKLRSENIKLELPSENEIITRLDNVLRIIYLLFNEGYYSRTQNKILREDFCLEAMHLADMLTEFDSTNQPKTNALLALMCFHASRFKARQDENSLLILYEKQDKSLWNQALIEQGINYLELSARGNELSSYHLEASIAFWHCHKEDTPEKWENILNNYDLLLEINYSPSVALNRAYALYKARGKKAALREAQKLKLINNHFYFILLGELYSEIDNEKARQNFEKAYTLAKIQTEKENIKEKLSALV
jgi:RNA polymerase sigma factor (sigma-70 family)